MGEPRGIRRPNVVKKAYDNFFRRVKEGKTPGYPRFQQYGRYDSFIYPQSGFSLTCPPVS